MTDEPQEIAEQKFNIWWKLTPVAAILTVLGWFAWMVIKDQGENWWPWLMICIWVCLFLPNLYLSTFALWHWKTRYEGRWAFAWAVAFVVWWAYLPGLAYFLGYILPELRGKNPYAKSERESLPPKPLPHKYTYLKSICFVVGLFLVVFGIVAATVMLVAHFAIWNVFEDTLAGEVGKEFTQSTADALWCGSQAGKVSVATSFIAALSASVGAVLLTLSQRMRWRLRG